MAENHTHNIIHAGQIAGANATRRRTTIEMIIH
jgi:hypothetical protein